LSTKKWIRLKRILETPQNKEETPQKLGFEEFPKISEKSRKQLKNVDLRGFGFFMSHFSVVRCFHNTDIFRAFGFLINNYISKNNFV